MHIEDRIPYCVVDTIQLCCKDRITDINSNHLGGSIMCDILRRLLPHKYHGTIYELRDCHLKVVSAQVEVVIDCDFEALTEKIKDLYLLTKTRRF